MVLKLILDNYRIYANLDNVMNATATKTKTTPKKDQAKGVLDSFQLFYEELPVDHLESGAPKTFSRVSRRSKH